MIGAIIGDVAGSTFEFTPCKTKNFPLFAPGSSFTDDTLMTIAVAQALTRANERGLGPCFAAFMRRMARRFPSPMGGYGARFSQWLASDDPKPYGSLGNGSAMRVSPCAEIAFSLDIALELARQSAEVTHSHPEGIRGAQAVAGAIYLARSGRDKAAIRALIEREFYPLHQTIEQIRPLYRFDETCRGTVPQAITAFLESESFEDAIRNAVSLGGDSDTLTCITGSIAWPYYARRGPDESMQSLRDQALGLLPEDLRAFVEAWDKAAEDNLPPRSWGIDARESVYDALIKSTLEGYDRNKSR